MGEDVRRDGARLPRPEWKARRPRGGTGWQDCHNSTRSSGACSRRHRASEAPPCSAAAFATEKSWKPPPCTSGSVRRDGGEFKRICQRKEPAPRQPERMGVKGAKHKNKLLSEAGCSRATFVNCAGGPGQKAWVAARKDARCALMEGTWGAGTGRERDVGWKGPLGSVHLTRE